MSTFAPFRYKNPDDFRHDLAEVEPSPPFADDMTPLRAPHTLAGKTVANRLAVHPMEGADGEADGAPGGLTYRRYRRFASGGAGLLWFEATAVRQDGRANPRQLYIHAGNVDAYKRLLGESLAAAEAAGGPRPFTVLQLTHSGRQSRPGPKPEPIIAEVNPVLDRVPGRVVSDDDLQRIRDDYLAAARMAAAIGFDAVDIKACHGYLLGELLAARGRPGRYGGSFENRTRLMLEIVEGVAATLGSRIAIASRFGVWDAVEYPYGWGVSEADPHVPDFTEPIRLARLMHERGGLCLLDITCGNPYFNPHVNRPFDKGYYTPPQRQLQGVASLLSAAKTIQAAVPEVAVVGTGLSWCRQFGANLAAGCVRDGWFTFAGFGRQSFAYPDFATDILQQGGLDPAKCCVACGNCTVMMRDGQPAGCMVRDGEVYLPIYREGRKDKPPLDMSRVAEHV